MVSICSNCIGIINKELSNLTLCDKCKEVLENPHYNDLPNTFYKQMQDFLDSRSKKSIIFGFSGGLDSTVTLSHLVKECKIRNIKIIPITIDYGFKGKKTWSNINNVLNFLKVKENHVVYDICSKKVKSKEIEEFFGPDLTVFNFYKKSYLSSILPCGKLCNYIIDKSYQKILSENNESFLVTGGDTPKINKEGKYSIYWETKGFIIVRGGCAFQNTKKKNINYIKEKKIPWKDPQCGGYDTDCLLPGAILFNMQNKNSEHSLEETVKKLPILFDYFSERVRWGIIEKEVALESVVNYDLASEESLKEIKYLCNKGL